MLMHMEAQAEWDSTCILRLSERDWGQVGNRIECEQYVFLKPLFFLGPTRNWDDP